MMNGKFFSNWIVRNLILGAIFITAIILVSSIFLSIRTKHGQEKTVPDFSNMSVADAEMIARAAGVNVKVTDSIYMSRAAKGSVIGQFPKEGSKVKEGRTISLTINTTLAKKVKMPELVGVSLRQAKAELTSKGLMIGQLKYVSDIATNVVLHQTYKGRDIKSGREIPSGSAIDLVLGINSADGQAYVPNLKGFKYLKAVDAIHENSLNVSATIFDKSVRNYSDSLNAVVYKQRPEADGMPTIMGSGVTVFLTTDASKL